MAEWQRVRPGRELHVERSKNIRAVVVSVGAAAIMLVALLTVSQQPGVDELMNSAAKKGRKHRLDAAHESGAPQDRREVLVVEHEAAKDQNSHENRTRNSWLRYTELVDGTRSDRFNPVTKHAAQYDPQAPKQDRYHVARLTGVDTDGSASLCGRAEVKYDGTWGSICSKGWSQTDAQMFCKSIGLTGGTARYSLGNQPTWDDTVITHTDSTHISQRAEWGKGSTLDPPRQPDSNVIWMTEVKCVGNEENILDCPFGGHPGDGTLAAMDQRTWVDYASFNSSVDASNTVGLCCDVSAFCPPRSVWAADYTDDSHLGQKFGAMMSTQQVPEVVGNCKCDAGFYMVASHVYAGRCKACPEGSCSPPGSTSVFDCFCLEGFYKDEEGLCVKCPANSCSDIGKAASVEECKCFAGFYLSAGE
jgi:hypothetical protein